MNEIEEKLKKPLPDSDIEWRISRSYFATKKATVLAYMTSRGVMDRLDEVFGFDGWSDSYEFIGNNVVCTLTVYLEDHSPASVCLGGRSISKSDGAPQTDYEAFKGGISDALKRTAVKFGVGRYLYKLTEVWVELSTNRPTHLDKDLVHYLYDKDSKQSFYWITPHLPAWALLDEDKSNKKPTKPQSKDNDVVKVKIAVMNEIRKLTVDSKLPSETKKKIFGDLLGGEYGVTKASELGDEDLKKFCQAYKSKLNRDDIIPINEFNMSGESEFVGNN